MPSIGTEPNKTAVTFDLDSFTLSHFGTRLSRELIRHLIPKNLLRVVRTQRSDCRVVRVLSADFKSDTWLSFLEVIQTDLLLSRHLWWCLPWEIALCWLTRKHFYSHPLVIFRFRKSNLRIQLPQQKCFTLSRSISNNKKSNDYECIGSSCVRSVHLILIV